MKDIVSTYRVVLVDDAPAVREALRWALEDAGGLTVVGEAGDGFAAIDRTMALTPDLVILDVEMPGLDGYTVSRALKALPRPPAVIFLTVHDKPEFRDRGIAAGGDSFVVKGAGWQTLITQIRRVLGGGTAREYEASP